MNYHDAQRARPASSSRRGRYTPPSHIDRISFAALLERAGRSGLTSKQLDFLGGSSPAGAVVYYAGDIDLVTRPAVSVVGAREVSEAGARRAGKLARELVAAGVVVVSGLARGVDEAAHTAAIEAGGSTIAVVGTPLDKSYPAEHASLQEAIYREHLLISPFRVGEPVYRSNFPVRNRVMAAITDATVIVEASDTSGSLHQAAECSRLGRWLFILRGVAEDPRLTWPAKFIGQPKVAVLSATQELLKQISPS
jgi:DNA protecting protein DprA